MSRVIFKSKRGDFERKNEALKDMITGHMAMDIDVNLKTSAGMPVKNGVMKSATTHFRSPRGGYRVEIGKEYATYQERGMRADGSHVVRNYSTPGTSKGFFKRAINGVIKNKRSYIDEAKRALDL